MIIKKKAQGSIELMVVFGAVLFFFVSFFAVLQNNIYDKNEDKERILLQNIALTVKEEINLAASASEGYYREFTIPEKIFGKDYQINLSNNFVYVSEQDVSFAYRIAQTNGTIKKGINTITKQNQQIYLNYPI
jgi:hypothetical protein